MASTAQIDDTRVAEWPELPRLQEGQVLDLQAIRDTPERVYRVLVWIPTVYLALVLLAIVIAGSLGFPELALLSAMGLGFWLFSWMGWKLALVFIVGHTVEVGPAQYPQLYNLVRDACRLLQIAPARLLVMQGHGLVELFIAKWFMRRGVLILTSNLIDEVTKSGSSRQLMFLVGRQLGLIKMGYFRFWIVQHVIGRLALLAHSAWERRCQFSADKVGLLVAGDLYASEQALLTLTAGASLAPGTSLDAIEEQKNTLFESPWAWLRLAFASYPYMVDRLVRLRAFAHEACARGVQVNAKAAVGIIPLVHRPIRAIPVMIIHGHDAAGRLELENLLLKRFPHIAPIAMIAATDSAQTLPEKFERIARDVKGAIALLTPDDRVATLRSGAEGDRPRQNAVIEIGWFWGKIGRGRCLLLTKGSLELPSDLSGVEIHRFHQSPVECSEAVRDFLETLETAA